MKCFLICLSLLLFSLKSLDAFAQSESETKTQIKKVESGLVPPVRFEGDSIWTLESRMKHYGVPGLSIAVIKDSKIIWAKSYGIMDRQTKLPVTNQTLFQAASISKPVAAYAALKEVEKGKINLDEDVNLYLKSWKLPDNEFTKEKKVSLKHLLSHSAGTTVHGFLGYSTSENVPTLLQVLDGAAPANSGAIRVNKKPGGTFRYSGGGYVVMQQMLIDIERKPFPAIMDELVLQPLGMKHSTYSQPLPPDKLKWAATGYLPNGIETPGKRHTYPEMAPAGLWTTAEDLARFAIDLQLTVKGQSKKVLSQNMADKMTSPFIESFEGLGIFLDKKANDLYFQHSGWNEGFSSYFVAHKNKGYGVVILTNGNQPPLINELARAVAATYNWPNYVLPILKKLPLTVTDAQQDTGRYRNEKYSVIKIYQNGQTLFSQKDLDDPQELFKIADNTFIKRDWEAKIKFVIDPSNNIRHIAYVLGTDTVRYINPKMKEDQKMPYELVLDGQFEKAVSAYKQALLENPNEEAIGENYINLMGYKLLQSKALGKSIDMFKVNTILYPNSANAYDSLAEAYMNNGDKQLAKQNYLLSLKLNPNNENATKMLQKLN